MPAPNKRSEAASQASTSKLARVTSAATPLGGARRSLEDADTAAQHARRSAGQVALELRPYDVAELEAQRVELAIGRAGGERGLPAQGQRGAAGLRNGAGRSEARPTRSLVNSISGRPRTRANANR